MAGEPASILSRTDPSEARPDEGYIRRLIMQFIYEDAKQDARDRIRDTVFWQENDIPHPTHVDFQEVHFGVATEVVTRIVGILSDRPMVTIGNTTLSDMKVRRAEKVQDFLNGLFPALEDESDTDTWDHIKEDVIRFGRAYDVLEYVPGRYGAAAGYPQLQETESSRDYERRQKVFRMGRMPMRWRWTPARGVHVHRDDDGLSEVLILEERTVADLMHRYSLPKLSASVIEQQGTFPNLPLQHAVFCRYFNRKYAAYWVSRGFSSMNWSDRTLAGESLLSMAGSMAGELATQPWEHGYTDQWGRGVVPVVENPGMTTTSINPGKKNISVIDHVIPIATYLDQLVSQKASAVRMWAWPTPYLKNLGVNGSVLASAPVGDDMRPIPVEIEPGKLLTLLPGEDIGWLIAPTNGAGADELIATIQRQADMLGISSALFDAQAMQANGYLYNSIVNSVRSKFTPIVTHLRRAHRKRCQHALQIVKMHGEPLYIFKPGDGDDEVGEWLECGPKDIEGTLFQINVAYEDHLPVDDASNLALAVQATDPNHPLLDDDTARVKYGITQDPKRIDDKLLIQEFERSDVVKQALMMEAVSHAQLQIQQAGMTQMAPEQLANLPPALAAQLAPAAIAGALPPNGGGGAPQPGGGNLLAAPSTMGGVPGAPSAAAGISPGQTEALTPAPPGPGVKPGPKKKGGRPAGQSRNHRRPGGFNGG